MSSLQPGLTGEVTWTVSAEHTAASVGSGLVQVFSTPMLVGLMETAAVRALTDHLPDGDTTVGARIDVQHLAATPVGLLVHARATLRMVEDRKLTFEIEAWDDHEVIGRAHHERFIVNKARFEAKALRKQPTAD